MAAGVVCMAALVAAALGVGAHFLGPVSTAVTLLASFAPLSTLLALLLVVPLVLTRFRIAAVVAALVAAVGIAAESPLYIAATSTAAEAPKLRLLQANIRLGEADPDTLASLVRNQGVDVLTVSELTEPAAQRLSVAGLDGELPFSFIQPREGGNGAGIFSRHPLTDAVDLPGLRHKNLRAVVDVPGAGPVAVYALHPLPPYPEPSWRWALELDRIGAILADEPLPIVIGGDFNSTYDHERFRNLLRAGARDGFQLADAAEFLGAGIVPTYPADQWYPAVLAIDRILTRGTTAVSFDRIEVPGSDHYGVIGDVLLAAPAE